MTNNLRKYGFVGAAGAEDTAWQDELCQYATSEIDVGLDECRCKLKYLGSNKPKTDFEKAQEEAQKTHPTPQSSDSMDKLVALQAESLGVSVEEYYKLWTESNRQKYDMEKCEFRFEQYLCPNFRVNTNPNPLRLD